MIRVLLYIVVVALIGAGFAFIANHPGDLVMTFGQTRVSVSVLVGVAVLVAIVVAVLVLWWLLRVIFSAPKNVAKHFHDQRQLHGHEALSTGILAVLSGDGETARRMNKRVEKYLDSNSEPLAKLLEAQTLLLENDTPNAIHLFEEMSKDPKTKLVGLHGLYKEAIKSGAYEAASQYAETATYVSPSVKWANSAMLDRLSAEGEWDRAVELFDRAEKALPRAERATTKLNHRRAVLLTGQAMDMFENHPGDARSLALKAQKLDPSFVPATTVAAEILYKMHEVRKANKLVEAAWQKHTHPDLARVYLNQEERAVERLKKAKTLSSHHTEQYDSYYCVAKAAFDAGELKLAREQAEKALGKQPRESVYLLLADIEEADTGQQGRVRQWLSLAVRAERDPVWVADSVIFEEWAPVSPISGRLDAFEWKAPSRHLGAALDGGERLPQEQHLPQVDAIVDHQDKAPASEPKSADVALKPSKAKVSKKPVVTEELATPIFDAVNPDAEPKGGQKTRINVDDPGVNAKTDGKPAAKDPFKVF